MLDHPFAAASVSDGKIKIKGLPANRTLVFRANHEELSLRQVIQNGAPTEWRGSRFEVTLEPGENDLGHVLVPPFER